MNNDTIYRQAAIAHAISGLTREFEGEKWIKVSEVRDSIQRMPSAEWNGRMSDFTQCIYLLLIVKEANRINLITDESYREFLRALLKLNCPNYGAEMKGE